METTRATTTRPPVPQSVCFLLASNHAQACCQSGKCVASDSIYRGRNVPVRARKCKPEIGASDLKGASGHHHGARTFLSAAGFERRCAPASSQADLPVERC